MNGPCIFYIIGLYNVSNFFSAFNTISYSDVSASASASFLRYVNSDDCSEILFVLTLSPSSGIMSTGILYYSSDAGMMSSSIPGTKYYLSASRNIFRVSVGSVIFQSAYLASLFIMTLLVYGLYKLYVSVVLLSAYPTIISLNIFYVI